MEFRKFTVDGSIFPDEFEDEVVIQSETNDESDPEIHYENFMKENDQKGEHVKDFFEFLALCHKCVVEKDKHGNKKYSSQSPDEEALVKAAA